MKYLADTSALVRILRRQVDPLWEEQIRRGMVAICEPVVAETLTMANASEYKAVDDALHRTYPWVPVPDTTWHAIREMRHALAERSAHQGLSVADYLVVATAAHHRLTVLHEDNDFRTVAGIVPHLSEHRISIPPS